MQNTSERTFLRSNPDKKETKRRSKHNYKSLNSNTQNPTENHPCNSYVSDYSVTASELEQQQEDVQLRKRTMCVSVIVMITYMAAVVPNDVMMPQYVVHRLARDQNLNINHTSVNLCGNLSDPTVINSNTLEAEASSWILYYIYALCGPAVLFCLFFGGFTDVFGRRVLLVISLFGGTVRMIITMLLIRFSLPLWVGYIACAVDGLTGSFYIMFVAIFSATADVNKVKTDRVFWIAVLTVVSACTTSVFTVITGLLIDSTGFFPPALMCVGTTSIAFLASLLFFPETCPMIEQKCYSPLMNFKRIAGFFIMEGSASKKISFYLCIGIFFFAVINILCPGKINTMYQMREPFCWSSADIGIYYGASTFGQFLIGLAMLRILQLCLKVEWIALIGSLFQCGSFVMEAFIRNNWEFALVPVVGILGSTTVPIIRGVTSSLVSAKDQGAMFSSIAIIEVLCTTLSNTAILKVYSSTVATMPGAVFILMASFSFTAALLMMVFLCVHEEKHDYKDVKNDDLEHSQTQD